MEHLRILLITNLDRTIEGIITLKDRDGNISKGKLAEGTVY